MKAKSPLVCLLLTALVLLTSFPSHAEYFGLPSGRTADVSSMAAKSLDTGFVTGDLGEASYQGFGARFNAQLSDVSMVYLDAMNVDIEDASGTILGLGFIYQLEGVLQETDVAIKAAYHDGKVKQEGRRDSEGDVLSVEALLSSRTNIGESKMRWYANLGMHKFDLGSFDETEIGFGGGIFLPTSFGEFFAGADMIDELTFGLGIRYFLQ